MLESRGDGDSRRVRPAIAIAQSSRPCDDSARTVAVALIEVHDLVSDWTDTPMSRPTISEAVPSDPSSTEFPAYQLGSVSVLALSAWCGLVSGLLEVGVVVLRKRTFDPNHFYMTSRHFPWLIPLTNLALFLALGVVFSLLIRTAKRRGRWLAPRCLVALTLLPAFWAAFPQIFSAAGLLVVVAIAVRTVPMLERHGRAVRRLLGWSFPIVAGVVPILAASLAWSDRIKQAREDARPPAPPGSPHVVLIVLDTVAADHLSLHGYGRPTSTTINELAARAIRFDRAQSTSSWTLPSHASMFTGRWPHELSAGWLTPLDGADPTLAEYLAARGYAASGFAANYSYCAYDSGLARGFATYRDYIFPRLTAFKAAALVDRPIAGLQAIERLLEDRLGFDLLKPGVQYLWRLFEDDRKEAAVVNREFLDWLSRQQLRQPQRPFFAFLNYFDAHFPYELPALSVRRFAARPSDNRQANLIRDWLLLIKGRPSPGQIGFVRDSYDDCVANLDEHLGLLVDELKRRAVLERTWLFIVGDHGESFGEHAGVFCHGMSLYQTEVHVPLVIIPPGVGTAPRVVREAVSLRDLPATIVEILGLEAGSPFPGKSLARFWKHAGAPAVAAGDSGTVDRTLSEVVPTDSFSRDPSQIVKRGWPLGALTEGDWSYVRREGPVREELFHLRDDALESRNLVDDPALRPRLQQMRRELGRLTAGPLTPQRFSP